MQKDVILVVLVIVVQTFVFFVIRVFIDPVDGWNGNITERGAGDEHDNRKECKDGVCLDGVRPHEWSLEANC